MILSDQDRAWTLIQRNRSQCSFFQLFFLHNIKYTLRCPISRRCVNHSIRIFSLAEDILFPAVPNVGSPRSIPALLDRPSDVCKECLESPFPPTRMIALERPSNGPPRTHG